MRALESALETCRIYINVHDGEENIRLFRATKLFDFININTLHTRGAHALTSISNRFVYQQNKNSIYFYVGKLQSYVGKGVGKKTNIIHSVQYIFIAEWNIKSITRRAYA